MHTWRDNRSAWTFLGYRALYACVAAALMLTALLILADALPDAPVPAWIHQMVGDMPILFAVTLVLGLMALLLVHTRHITLTHLTVIRHNMDAVLLTGTDGRILTANPAASELFGYSERELKSGGRQLLVYAGDPEVEAMLAQRAAKGAVRGEMWMRHRNGRRIRVELSSVMFDFKGEQRSAMIIRDVSRTRQSDYERRIAQTVFEDISQAVCVIDEQWRQLWFNHATERITGYTRSELMGQPTPLRRRLEQEAPEVLEDIERTLQAEGQWSGEVHTRRKTGEMYPLYGTMTRVESPVPGHPHIVTTFSDVSAIRDYERKLRNVSQYDFVTALPNRVLFEEKVQQALGRADPDSDTLALMLIDIDGFRIINESLGHEAGDRVLQAASHRLVELTGSHALVGRHAGDSFAVLVEDVAEIEEASLIASNIVSGFHAVFEGSDKPIRMTVGIGLACFPDEGSSVATLLRHAEIALGKAKQDGGDGFRLYEAGSEQDAHRFVTLAADIREALEANQFVAHFQPILETARQQVVAMEALARWPRPGQPPIGPVDFIPVAERSGLIAQLSEHMLRQACAHLHAMRAAGFPDLSVSVNLSARQFRDPRLDERIFAILREENVSPASIILEITESLLMDDPEHKRLVLEKLQAGGLRVVMDDFGTGYSSLGYLKHFELDGIKMDHSFTQNLPHASRDVAIVRTILAIGHELDLPVVAEGIENVEQARFLSTHGCPSLQGNYIGKPMSSDDFLDFLRRDNPQKMLHTVDD